MTYQYSSFIMSSLFFIVFLSLSITIDIILINLTKNIAENIFYILSLIFLGLSLSLICSIALSWLLIYRYLKRLLVVNCFFIKNALIIFFLTAHYYGDYIPPYFGGLYFLNFTFSFLLLLSNNEDRVRISPVEISLTSIVVVQEKTVFEPNCCILYKNSSCSICLEELLYKEYVHITTCNHYFHSSCLNKLLESNIKCCPNCRNKIVC